MDTKHFSDQDDWLPNARRGMSGHQFLASLTAAGAGLAGFAIAASSVAGEVVTTRDDGLAVAEAKLESAGFQAPVYEARPAAAGR
jgi:hypothetical protein